MTIVNKRKLPIFTLYLFLLLSIICCASKEEKENTITPPLESYDTLRILTYNIYHGETTSGRIDLELFAEIINNTSPDLVALQEVDNKVDRSENIDITAELSNLTGLDGYFGKFQNYRNGEYGAAILSKFPVVEFDLRQAYSSPGEPEVAFLMAKIELAKDRYIYFNSSHLSLNYTDRETQIKQLVSYYENTINKSPLIICGDLNAEAADDEMNILLNQFALSDPTLANTFSTRTGMRKKIDFILSPKNENWEVIETEQICRVDASDHCALLSILKYKN